MRKSKTEHEPISNIVMICGEHAPKVDPRWAKKRPNWFIGKLVKKSFAVHGDPRITVEHMWVKVTHVVGQQLHGHLENDPFYATWLKNGDSVVVLRSQIEQVMP